MNKPKLMILLASFLLPISCGQSQQQGVSNTMSLIGQNDADSVCSAAGETYLPLASRYDLSVNKSWDDPSFTMASGVFTYDAPFDYGRRKVVDADRTSKLQADTSNP